MIKGQIIEKVRFLYVPFLLLSTSLLIGYTFLNWLLISETHIISINEKYTDYFIPVALAGGLVYFFLRPCLKRLKFKDSGSRTFYVFIAAIAVAAPVVIAQSYLRTATGKLTQLQRVSEIRASAPTKYYAVRDIFADYHEITSEASADVSDRYQRELRFLIYLAAPLYDSVTDVSSEACDVWLSVHYVKTIDNRLDESTKSRAYDEFLTDSVARFNGLNLRRLSYFEQLGENDDREVFERAIAKSKLRSHLKHPIILLGQEAPFEQRSASAMHWLFGSYATGAIVWLLMLLFPKLESARHEKVHSEQDFEGHWWQVFIPIRGFAATPIIVDANIVIFLVMVLSGLGFGTFRSADLVSWGANYWPLVRDGQWFRLVTSVFIHGGVMHLALNTYGLLLAGYFLEPRLTTTKFVFAYLATGVAASLTSGLVHPDGVSVGASGAIFGLWGTYIVLLLASNLGLKGSKNPILNFVAYVALNLFIGAFTVGVDNAAHVGGLLCGAILGLVFFVMQKLSPQPRCRS